MYLIAAVDKNWGIGKDNKLLARVPEDLKYFSNKTKGNVIIIGRKTLESFKDGKPLKDRTNIVLTNNKQYKCKDTIILHSIEELLDNLKGYTKEIYVCGGETIYTQLLPYCEKAFITKLAHAFEADSYFPNLDENKEWKLSNCNKEQVSKTGIIYRFCEYDKVDL